MRFDVNIAIQGIYDLRRRAKRRGDPEPPWSWSWESVHIMVDTTGVSAIHWAILRSNYKVFRRCIDVAKTARGGQQYLEGKPCHAWPRKVAFEYNPLQLTLRMKETAMTKALLKADCSPHVMWCPGGSSSDRVHVSCSKTTCGYQERRADLGHNGCVSTLNIAIQAGNVEAVQMLLDHGAEPMEGTGVSAFHWAGTHAKLTILKALTSKPEHRDQCVELLTSTFFKETPLHLVCKRPSYVNELIDHFLSLDPQKKYTIINAKVGLDEDVRPPILLALEAVKNCFNPTGETVIHLIRHGTDITEEKTKEALKNWLYKVNTRGHLRDHLHDPQDFLVSCFEAALPNYPDEGGPHGRNREALFGFWREGLEDALKTAEIEEFAWDDHGLDDNRAGLSQVFLEQLGWLILVAKYLARQGVPMTRLAKQRVEWAATTYGVQFDWDSWCLEEGIRNQDYPTTDDLEDGNEDNYEESETDASEVEEDEDTNGEENDNGEEDDADDDAVGDPDGEVEDVAVGCDGSKDDANANVNQHNEVRTTEESIEEATEGS